MPMTGARSRGRTRGQGAQLFPAVFAWRQLEELIGERFRPEDGDIAHRVGADGDHGLRLAGADSIGRLGHGL